MDRESIITRTFTPEDYAAAMAHWARARTESFKAKDNDTQGG